MRSRDFLALRTYLQYDFQSVEMYKNYSSYLVHGKNQ